MARYTGPKSRVARKFGDPIFGPDKHLERKNFPPGQHGMNKKEEENFGIWDSAQGETESKIYLWRSGTSVPEYF